MKRLLVFRHAKAGPHDEKNDRQRDLVQRGREDGARMGGVMRTKGYVPQLVLCSSARRTVETWNHAAPSLGADPTVEFLDALYDASDTAVLNCVRAVGPEVSTLLYIGHNPGLERLARRLARRPASADERRRNQAMSEKFPTAALAVLDFDSDSWAGIEPARGVLSDFLTPRGLSAD